MIIFGWGGRKLTDKGAVWAATCPNCHNMVFFHYLTTHSAFRLYFVPLIPYGRKHFLACPVCSQGRQLNDAGVELVKQAQLLLARVRTNELTEPQYQLELARLRNPNAAILPATVGPGSSDAAISEAAPAQPASSSEIPGAPEPIVEPKQVGPDPAASGDAPLIQP